MNNQSKVIDQDGAEVLDPHKALAEQTLAVDLARADFDQAIVTAHKYPRMLDTVVKQIETMSCYNEDAAGNCIYSLPRGGKPIIGPSIGFANILATAWGNCIDAGRPTYVDRKEKLAYGEGIFHDLQTNRRTVIHESRRISGKNGAIYSDDMVAITGKAAAAIARRNAILNAVPRAIWHPIWEQALRIVRGDQETFAERKDKALKAFHQFGVKPEQIFMVLRLKGEIDLTLEHIPLLRGMYLALRDGSATVEEMFDPRRMTGMGFDTVENPLGDEEETDAIHPASAGAGPGGPVAPSAGPASQPEASQKPAGAPATETARTAAPPQASAQATAAGQANAPKAKAEPAKTAVLPKNEEEYLAYARAWFKTETVVAAIEDRWRSERKMRNSCGLTEQARAPLEVEKKARVAELSGSAK